MHRRLQKTKKCWSLLIILRGCLWSLRQESRKLV